jgi:hypothetical protein
MSHANIVTQVSQEAPAPTIDEDVDMGSIINLNIRGTLFRITRDELMNLPESILLCLFPNGVFVDAQGNTLTNLTEEDIVYVNFDPNCFQYIFDSFANAAKKLPKGTKPEVYDAYQTPDVDVLSEKPAVIVLREDMDYYVIPPRKGINAQGIRAIKQAAGSYLTSRANVFEGLGYAPGKKLGPAEEHLLDMLCSSGFTLETNWGHRAAEPGKTVLTSLALVNLRNLEPAPDSPLLDPVASNSSQGTPKQSRRSRLAELATNAARSASRSSRNSSRPPRSAGTSSKLLLFWRKPARKCWWANEIVELKVPGVLGEDGLLHTLKVHLHIRRVWTLELSVIGVH